MNKKLVLPDTIKVIPKVNFLQEHRNHFLAKNLNQESQSEKRCSVASLYDIGIPKIFQTQIEKDAVIIERI